MNDVLLLTATIAPRANTYLLARADPEERLADYCEAFAFYLKELAKGTFSTIVFVDNSGYSLDRLKAMATQSGLNDRVHFISYVAPDESQMGRFYLELRLLIEALGRPPFDSMAPETRIWKVTGRYVVRNIGRIVRSAPKDADLYINSRNRPRRWTDFYLVAFNRTAFQQILADKLDLYRTQQNGEEILREQIDEARDGPLKIVSRMRHVPHLSGYRGFDNGNYGGARDLAKYWLRVMVDRLLPWLWI